MKRNFLIGVGIVLIGIITSCSNAKEMGGDEMMISDFKLNDTIILGVNGMAICESDPNLFVKFDSLVNDSRCPKNASCIWEGDAEIKIDMTYKKELEKINLHTSTKMGNTSEAFGYKLQLVGLTPYPGDESQANDPIQASIIVTKL